MIITTTESVDQFRIAEYMTVISADIPLGKSSTTGGMLEAFGKRSAKAQTSFDVARDRVLEMLTLRAEEMGGQAIIGFKLSVVNNRHDKKVVLGTGTLVKLAPTELSANAA